MSGWPGLFTGVYQGSGGPDGFFPAFGTRKAVARSWMILLGLLLRFFIPIIPEGRSKGEESPQDTQWLAVRGDGVSWNFAEAKTDRAGRCRRLHNLPPWLLNSRLGNLAAAPNDGR